MYVSLFAASGKIRYGYDTLVCEFSPVRGCINKSLIIGEIVARWQGKMKGDRGTHRPGRPSTGV